MPEPEYTNDLPTLQSATATIDSLIEEMDAGLLANEPIRQQIPRILALADQYDLVGRSDIARDFKQQARLLIPLRDLQDRQLAFQDRQLARKAQQDKRRNMFIRILTLGIWRKAS